MTTVRRPGHGGRSSSVITSTAADATRVPARRPASPARRRPARTRPAAVRHRSTIAHGPSPAGASSTRPSAICAAVAASTSTVAMPRTASIGASTAHSSGDAASSIVNGPTAIRRSRRRWAPPPRRWPRSAASVRTYVPAEHSTSIASTTGSPVGTDVEAVDGDRPRRPLDLDALAGQVVQPAPLDADRRDHRRHLLDVAGQVLGDHGTGVVDRHPAMSWVATTVPSASSVSVSTPSTTSPV